MLTGRCLPARRSVKVGTWHMWALTYGHSVGRSTSSCHDRCIKNLPMPVAGCLLQCFAGGKGYCHAPPCNPPMQLASACWCWLLVENSAAGREQCRGLTGTSLPEHVEPDRARRPALRTVTSCEMPSGRIAATRREQLDSSQPSRREVAQGQAVRQAWRGPRSKCQAVMVGSGGWPRPQLEADRCVCGRPGIQPWLLYAVRSCGHVCGQVQCTFVAHSPLPQSTGTSVREHLAMMHAERGFASGLSKGAKSQSLAAGVSRAEGATGTACKLPT